MKMLIAGCLLLSSSFLNAGESGMLSVQPSEWRLRVTKDASERGKVYIVDTIATEKFGTEFVIRKGKYGSTEFSADNLYVGNLSDKERDMVWMAFKEDLSSFKFVEPTLGSFGESFVSAELRVGARSIEIAYGSLSDTKGIPAGLKKILRMAERRLDDSKSNK